MDAAAYAAFTAELTELAAADPRVVGLVAVGSMADRYYASDDWSDHDFLLVSEPGEQEALRAELGWLPHHDRIALAFRETEHGLKVVYDDGHMLEFAVFDLEEIGLAGINRYRVLLDRGGVEERCTWVRDHPRPQPDDEHLFGMAVTAALVAAGRARRGAERLLLRRDGPHPRDPSPGAVASGRECVASRRLRPVAPLRARPSRTRCRACSRRRSAAAGGGAATARRPRARAASAPARARLGRARRDPRLDRVEQLALEVLGALTVRAAATVGELARRLQLISQTVISRLAIGANASQ